MYFTEEQKEVLKEELLKNIIINKETNCWEWTGKKRGFKTFLYGLMCKYNQNIYCHRLSYYLYNGDIPDKMFVCHKCDNPSCCNPEHLFLGTNGENMHDCYLKGRHLFNRKRKLTDEDVMFIRNSKLLGSELAKKFNVYESTISAIRLRKIYKHLIV